MFDILDLVKRRKKEVFSGYYYEYKTSAPVYFEYKNQNYPRSVFTEVINNLIVEGRNLVITTTWALKWKLNSKIVLQDGKTYIINEMQSECYNDENQRFLAKSPNCEFILALKEVAVARPGGQEV